MTCNTNNGRCSQYKTYNLCPIKRGDTLPQITITATIKDYLGVESPMDIASATMTVSKYGKEVFTLPTTVSNGVVRILEVSGDVTKEWSKAIHTYTLTFVMGNGRVVSYLSGEMEVC